LETTDLAREIYGSLAPSVLFRGELGDSEAGKEGVCVYVMERIRGISYLEFILKNDVNEDSKENFEWRKRLMVDVARYSPPPPPLFFYLRGVLAALRSATTAKFASH